MENYKVLLSERGQIVIPAEIRKKFKTREFIISLADGKIIMSPSKVEEEMTSLVTKIKEMNKKYERFAHEKIDVLSEIKKGGA